MKKKSIFGFSFFIMICTLLFFYIPIFTLAINSFNNSKYSVAWNGFTLKWYIQMFNNQELISALYNSIIIGIIAALFAMIIGTIAAFCIYYYRSKLQFIHKNIFLIQLVVPDIFIGISILFFFTVVFKWELGLFTTIITHITFCIVYVVVIVYSRLQYLQYSIIESAIDLGASWISIYRFILIPFIFPSILAGGLLAFTVSLDDFIITFFVTGSGNITLPVYIYSMLKHGDFSIINALSTLMIVGTIIIIICLKDFLFLNRNKK